MYFNKPQVAKNTLVKYKPEVYGPGENPTEFKMNPIMEERMKNVRGIGGLFEEDVPNVRAGRGRSQVPRQIAANIFDMTQDRSAPVSTAASSSVPPPRTRDVSGEGATSAAGELAGLMAVQVQQQQDKFKKTREMFEKGQPGPLGITFVPQRVVESAPSHLNIPHQFGQSAIAMRDARNPELYSGLYAGASSSGATSSSAPFEFQGKQAGEVHQRDIPKESPNPTRQKKAKPEEQQVPPQVPKMPEGPPSKSLTYSCRCGCCGLAC